MSQAELRHEEVIRDVWVDVGMRTPWPASLGLACLGSMLADS